MGVHLDNGQKAPDKDNSKMRKQLEGLAFVLMASAVIAGTVATIVFS